MKRLPSFFLAAVLAFAGVLGAMPRVASADDACGSHANPCPLQKWMQSSMGSKLTDGDLAAVAVGFDKVATMSPDATWTDWAKFARDGAAAARKGGDEGKRGAKAACKGCHDAYKTQYKTRFRTRPVP